MSLIRSLRLIVLKNDAFDFYFTILIFYGPAQEFGKQNWTKIEFILCDTSVI